MNEKLIVKVLDEITRMIPIIGLKLFVIILILVLTPKIIKIVFLTLDKVTKKNMMDPLLASFLRSLISTSIYILIGFFLLEQIGVKGASIVTLLGTAGLAIGLALQGSLSNLAGGILILFCKQFSKGDYIATTDGSIEGTVKTIQILYTELETINNQTISVPNGALSNSGIMNYSKNEDRRLDLVFSASYDNSVELVIEVLNKIADEHPKIIQDKERVIRLLKHNKSSLDYRFRAWTKRTDYFEVMYDCNEAVIKAFKENNIEIPYAKLEIYNKTNIEI